VKVLDFGIARLNWSEQSMATATGLIFGTARYISPEGAQGDKVGPPGDVYSIATLAYQMLAGRTPFEGDQAVGLLIQQIHEQPPPLRSHASAREVPPVIADVIMRALAKDPNARPDGARALGRAIVEAARASGVAADDFYARSLFAVGSGSGKARIAPVSDPALPNAAAAPHPPSNSTRDVGADVPAAGPTARWTPPAAVQAQLATVAAERRAANAGGTKAKGATAPGVRPRSDSVDPTLDDDDVPPAATKKTDYATPAAPFGATVRLESSPQITGPTGTLPLKNDVEPISDRLRPSPSEPRLTKLSGPEQETRAARVRSRPEISAERDAVTEPGLNATLDDEPSRRGFTVGIVFLCFLLGVGGAVAIHRSGVIQRIGQGGTTTVLSPMDAHVARAKDAVERERWEEPPGDNVRELMTTGLGRWPNEPRLLALKTQANDALVRRAVSVRPTDLREAARLARLASDIAPDNPTTRAIADDYARELAAVAPPLATVTPSPSVTAVRPPTAAPASAAKVALDTTPAKPRIGQSVQLVARVSSKSSVSDAAFFIVAVGQPQGTRLVPLMDGNIFRGAFTFLEPGRYEVSFTGKVDNAVVKSSRTIVIDSGATPAPETQTPPPAPSGSVKWL
jgi:serine/threonine-protein kinase